MIINLSSRFRREWLKDGYSDEATIIGHPALNEEARKALLRVPKRDGDLSTHPSPVDLKFLSDQYSRFVPSVHA